MSIVETYELSNKVFLSIVNDESIIVGTLSSPKEEIDLTPEETRAMIELLIDNNLYDPWLV